MTRVCHKCGERALVVIGYGSSYVGACRKHAGSVLLWTLELDGRGTGDQQMRRVLTADTLDQVYNGVFPES